MKKLIVTGLAYAGLVTSAQAQTQLAGTAWQGMVRAPEVTDVVLQFDRDTIRMYQIADKTLLETMSYTTKGDTFTWKKVSGGSPCDTQTPGTWRYTIKNNEMKLDIVEDACPARSGAMMGEPFKKVAFSTK